MRALQRQPQTLNKCGHLVYHPDGCIVRLWSRPDFMFLLFKLKVHDESRVILRRVGFILTFLFIPPNSTNFVMDAALPERLWSFYTLLVLRRVLQLSRKWVSRSRKVGSPDCPTDLSMHKYRREILIAVISTSILFLSNWVHGEGNFH